MKFKFLFFLAACLFFAGCSGDNEIKIGENLSAEQQQIAFRAVLENQYKAGDYMAAGKIIRVLSAAWLSGIVKAGLN